jgi:hypothetical protein
MKIFLGAIGCLAVVTIWASQTIPSCYKAYQACQIAKNWEPPKHQGAVLPMQDELEKSMKKLVENKFLRMAIMAGFFSSTEPSLASKGAAPWKVMLVAKDFNEKIKARTIILATSPTNYFFKTQPAKTSVLSTAP